MELLSTEISENQNTREFLNTAEFACLEETCRIATFNLSDDKRHLSERVARRCLDIGQLMGLSGSDLVRLEVAARVHRVGELFIDEELREKCFLDMTAVELQAYRHYPIFSSLRLSQHVSRDFYEILLNHREYYAGAGFLDALSGDNIPLSARILCVATEYEELLMYKGGDPARIDTIQRRMAKNTIGRYDPSVLEALTQTIYDERVLH